MRACKKRIWSGHVLEQIVYPVSDGMKSPKTANPRLRFKSDEERMRHRENIARKTHERAFHANFSPSSLYSTLTFDNEHEVHTFEEARKIRDNYVRRLRYAYPEAVFFLYMGRGRKTGRIHFHMVSEGIPAKVLIAKWKQGMITRIEYLRRHNVYDGIDRGRDYTGLANYLFNHWTEEQGGHHCYKTSNAKKFEKEDVREAKRSYSEMRPPTAPKGYILVEARSTDWGYHYFRYVKKPPERRDEKPCKCVKFENEKQRR